MTEFKKEIEAQLQRGAERERSLEQDCQALLQNLNDMKIQLSNLSHQLAEKDKEIAGLKANEGRMTFENKELSKFIKEYTGAKEQDSRELKEQISWLQKESEKAKLEFESQVSAIRQEGFNELKANETVLEQLQATIRQNDSQIAGLQSEKKAQEAKLAKLQEDNGVLARQLERLIAEIKQREEEFLRQKHHLEELNEKERIISKQLLDEKASLIRENQSKSNEVRVLESKVENLKSVEKEKEDLTESVKANETVLDQLQTTIRQNDSQIAGLQSEKKAQEAKLAKLQEDNGVLARQLERLIAEIKQREEEFLRQRQKLDEICEKERQTSRHLSDENVALIRENQKKSQEVSSLESTVENLKAVQREKENIAEEFKAASSRLVTVDTEKANLIKQLEHNQELLSESKRRLITATQESMAAKEEVRRMELEFVNIQGELERVNRLLELAGTTMIDKERQTVELVKQNGHLQDQCKRFHDLLDSSEQELSRLSDRTSEAASHALVSENRQLKSQLQSALHELATLRATLRRLRLTEMRRPTPSGSRKTPLQGENGKQMLPIPDGSRTSWQKLRRFSPL
jgi:chromosome segregation ATPase